MSSLSDLHQAMNDVLNMRLFRPDPLPAHLEVALLDRHRRGRQFRRFESRELIRLVTDLEG